MMKNKHLSDSVKKQCFHKFRQYITYKSELNGIELVVADRFYPSSKTCSKCGFIKKDLKLKDRVYRCPHCGAVIDRDLNASLNLSMYKLAQFHKQENANMQDSLYPNLSLWRIISNESSYGKIGFNEEGNKQIFIFLQIFGNGYILSDFITVKGARAHNLKNIDVVKSETNYLQILIVLKVEDKSDLHLVVNMNSKGAVELDSAVEKIVKYVIS